MIEDVEVRPGGRLLVDRSAPRGRDACAVSIEQGLQRSNLLNGVLGSGRDRLEEEIDPRFPCAVCADRLKQRIVPSPVPLEMQAEVEPRVFELAFGDKKQRNENSSDAAVAVEKWMNGLELRMCERRL